MARTYTTAERDHALDLYAKDGPAAAGEAQEAKALMTACAIGIDKAELLAGHATARLDVPPQVTPAEARLELEQLSRTLAARQEGRRDRMDGEIDRMLGEMAGRS